MSGLAPAYRPRRPTETVLYSIVREHLESFLSHARDSYEAPLPRYVEQELRGYLRCGVFAHGFVHCRCDTCGHDLLVAFSCKARAVCPSCAGRRMANTAAHLVDRVLPTVPVRQWVLSLPFELRALAAFRADVLSALSRIFVEVVIARYRACAPREKLDARATGAVTHVQRFGSSINLNVHFHTMVLDGVFVRDQRGRPIFHGAPAPTRRELTDIVARVHRRIIAWLGRKGHLTASQDAHWQDPAAPTAIDACAAIAARRGNVLALRVDANTNENDGSPPDMDPPPADGAAVEIGGFNLHASVAVRGDDDLGRERLMRYGARPPLALDRLRRLPGGRIAYRIKKTRDGRAKHRIMTPLEFLARLSALVPPPRYPLLRYHGVLAPRSSWRRDIVPRAPARPAPKPCSDDKAGRKRTTESRSESRVVGRSPSDASTPRATRDIPASSLIAPPAANTALVRNSKAQQSDSSAIWVTPNVLSVMHWNRLLGGLLYAATPRLDWATLLRRSFEVDVLRCAGCGGRLRVLREITEPAVVRLVLEVMGLPTEAPSPARARDPTELFGAAEVG